MVSEKNSGKPGQEPAIHSHKSYVLTADPCEHADSLPAWRQEYTQLRPGAFKGEIAEAAFGPVQVFRETIEQCVDEKANPRRDSYTVGVPVRVSQGGLWQGRELTDDSVMSLRPNEELYFKTPLYSSILVTVIDCNALNRLAESIEKSDIEALTRRPHALPGRIETVEGFRQVLTQTLDFALSQPQALAYPAIVDTLSDTVMQAVLTVLEDEDTAPKRHAYGQTVQRAIVERARSYVIANRHRPVTVSELCEHLKMSRRGVHHAFVNVLGINAITFLRYVKLHRIRKRLLQADPTDTVSSIAFSWGFWHMGMFASYYKQLFGESPSATLKRTTNVNTKTDHIIVG